MKTYRLSIYDFQPIHLDTSLLLTLYKNNYNQDRLLSKFFINPEKPEWMKQFDQLNETFQPMRSLAIQTEAEFDFLSNLNKSIETNTNQPFCALASKSAYLLFDPRLFSFMLSIEIIIDIDDKNVAYLNKENQPNLYHVIRQQLVSDGELNSAFLSQWLNSIKTSAIHSVINIISHIKKSKALNKQVSIPDNTGNITCMLTAYNRNGFFQVEESIQRTFLKINKQAERLITDQSPIKLTNKIDNTYDLIDFNGRMHTLVVNNPRNLYRYIPIMFHMQFMWFYIKSISPYLSSNVVSIICNNSQQSQTELENDIYSIIKRIEVLTIYNEQFKFSIESDNERIYENIESRWNIEKTLKQLQKNAESFGKHVIRDNENARQRSDRFKNTILAIISIIQILALTSIWNDHLSLLDKKQSIPTVFYSNWIEAINYNLLPSLLIISSIIGLIFLIKRNK